MHTEQVSSAFSLLVDMEDYCFYKNQLVEADLPILKRMGFSCFHESPALKKLSAPELQKMGDLCLEKVNLMWSICWINLMKLRKN